jgi:CBS domain-containing protein
MDIIPQSPEITPPTALNGTGTTGQSTGVMMDFIRKDLVCVESTDTLSEALDLMSEHHIGDVIVVESKDGARRPIGIVTDRDIALSLLASSEEDVCRLPVAHCMSKNIVTASVNEDVFSVIETLKSQGVGRIPLVDENGNLIGIVTAKNLLQKLVQGVNDLLFVTDDQQKQNELFGQRRH